MQGKPHGEPCIFLLTRIETVNLAQQKKILKINFKHIDLII